MDEPLSALDKQLREQMQIELRQLHDKLGMTTVYVTHDQREALTMSDRIAVINGGRIMQLDTPRAIYERPLNRFVAEFIGESSFLPVQVASGQVSLGGHLLKTARPPTSEGPQLLMPRPERLQVLGPGENADGALNILAATLVTAVYQGDSSLLQVALSDGSQVSALTTGICILLGYPLAYFLSELPKRSANLCMIAVLLPLWTSLLVRTYAWLVLLQRSGLINTWGIALGLWNEPLALVHNLTGTLIGTVHVMLPFLVLPLYSAMRAIDRNTLRAAANLGASPMRSFWLVFFPLAMPGLATGALIVFILCLGFYVTPAVLGGGKVIMVSSRIANDIEMSFNWGAASALGGVLLVLTAVLVLAASKLFRIDGALGRHGTS